MAKKLRVQRGRGNAGRTKGNGEGGASEQKREKRRTPKRKGRGRDRYVDGKVKGEGVILKWKSQRQKYMEREKESLTQQQGANADEKEGTNGDKNWKTRTDGVGYSLETNFYNISLKKSDEEAGRMGEESSKDVAWTNPPSFGRKEPGMAKKTFKRGGSGKKAEMYICA